MATDQNELELIRKRLDLVIHLLCLLVDPQKMPTISDEINLLSDRGLGPAEIGKIIGREANYVSASINRKQKVKEK